MCSFPRSPDPLFTCLSALGYWGGESCLDACLAYLQEAVEKALSVNDMTLAQHAACAPADLSQRQQLWLRLAHHAVSRCYVKSRGNETDIRPSSSNPGEGRHAAGRGSAMSSASMSTAFKLMSREALPKEKPQRSATGVQGLVHFRD